MADGKTREFDDKNQRQQMQEKQAFTGEDAPRPKEDYVTGSPQRREDPGTQSGTRQEENPHREQSGTRREQRGTGGNGGDFGGQRDLGQRDRQQGQPGEGRPDKAPKASPNRQQ